MIVAAIDPLPGGSLPPLFRGKTIDFWIRELFKPLDFQPIENISVKNGSILFFNPTRFLDIYPGDLISLLDKIAQVSDTSEKIHCLPGMAALIIPISLVREFRERHRLSFLDFLENKEKLYNTDWAYPVWDVHRDFLDVEKAVVRLQIHRLHQQNIIIEDYRNFFIEGGVQIGKGTRIHSGVVVRGDTILGENITLYPNVYIENSQVGDETIIYPGCMIADSIIESGVKIGPFAHLRNGTVIRKGAKVGNFVEMKKSDFGEGSKAMHLTYIGDAQVGQSVNIGAGTITCNYDGVRKHPTTIENHVFVGSGTELVAPVTLRKNSYIGAGSTITEEVPEGSLAVSRTKQRNFPGWASRKKQK